MTPKRQLNKAEARKSEAGYEGPKRLKSHLSKYEEVLLGQVLFKNMLVAWIAISS